MVCVSFPESNRNMTEALKAHRSVLRAFSVLKKSCFHAQMIKKKFFRFLSLRVPQHVWGPKVSKGRSESPLVAPAGAKPSAFARTYCIICKNAKYFANGMKPSRRIKSVLRAFPYQGTTWTQGRGASLAYNSISAPSAKDSSACAAVHSLLTPRGKRLFNTADERGYSTPCRHTPFTWGV